MDPIQEKNIQAQISRRFWLKHFLWALLVWSILYQIALLLIANAHQHDLGGGLVMIGLGGLVSIVNIIVFGVSLMFKGIDSKKIGAYSLAGLLSILSAIPIFYLLVSLLVQIFGITWL